MLFLAGLVFLASCGRETVRTFDVPEILPAPEIVSIHGDAQNKAPAENFDEMEGIRIGSFERPEQVPEYEILERKENRRDGAEGLRLLVDTKAFSKVAYERIARDLKARYSEYDAVSAEITDTSTDFDYNGSILIFNTPEGAYYMGFLYSPPNNRGYIVDVAE